MLAYALAFTLAQSQTPPDCCGMDIFMSDPEFIALHPLKKLKDWKPAKGEMTEFTTSEGKAKAFWVKPDGPDKPVIIMIHEFWGLNDNIRQTAEKMNTDTGYGVLAIDMYKGQVAEDASQARTYMGQVTEAYGQAVVAGAVKAIKGGELYSAPHVGTIGYCFGGGWSHKAAIAGGEDVDACVIYYGMPVTNQAELAKLKAPVLMVWPTQDNFINKEVVDRFKAAMEEANKPLTVESYDANHAFANPSNARYDKDSAEDAWSKTLAFYKKSFS